MYAKKIRVIEKPITKTVRHYRHGADAWYCVAPLTCPWVIDTLEIQISNLLLSQDKHESEHLFEYQAEPFNSSSFAMESIEGSIEAVDWNKKGYNVDIRPRLVNSPTGEAKLLDSGAQLSATMKGPEDKLDT